MLIVFTFLNFDVRGYIPTAHFITRLVGCNIFFLCGGNVDLASHNWIKNRGSSVTRGLKLNKRGSSAD